MATQLQPEVLAPAPVKKHPKILLAEAKTMAKVLRDQLLGDDNLGLREWVVQFPAKVKDKDGREHRVLKRYLTFTAWSFIARGFQVASSVVSTEQVTVGRFSGWKATAEAVDMNTGEVLSRADAICVNEEAQWAGKAQSALLSMAQTRASCKVLRMAFAFVAVLAGFEPTPAEEAEAFQNAAPEPAKEYKQPKSEPGGKTITWPQQKRFFGIGSGAGLKGDDLKGWLKSNFDIDSQKQIPMAQYDEICTALENWKGVVADKPPKAKGKKPGPKPKRKAAPAKDEPPMPDEEYEN